ncbi:hypothetical protein AUR66_05040 [Haloferax profundi]|uniref:Uncharacterized protein n=1 Tax=Haloferax profundi TaxID=1544718 RepID=A0A0W1R2U4_9EURY|nr:hypothetical protein AUR66_05040 [Haloferax profundi]
MSDFHKSGLLITLGSGFTVLSYVLTGFSNYAGTQGGLETAIPFALAAMYVAADALNLGSSSTSTSSKEVSR